MDISFDADKIARSAYIMAQAAILNAKVAGMIAENKIREHRGEALAYSEKDFEKAMDDSGCHHNDVLGYLYH